MSNTKYNISVILLFSLCVTLNFVFDVTWYIYDLVACISCSYLIFFLPGGFYLMSLKYTTLYRDNTRNKPKNSDERLAKLYIFFGVLVVILQITNIALKSTGKFERNDPLVTFKDFL